MSEHLFDLFRLELLADIAPEYLLASYVLDWEKYFALGSRLKAVIEAIDSFDFEKGTRLDFILPLLSTAHLPKCYVLSSFRYGVENFGHKYIPYVHKRRAIIEWCPPIDLNYESPIRGKRKRNLFQVSGPYKDHYYISGGDFGAKTPRKPMIISE